MLIFHIFTDISSSSFSWVFTFFSLLSAAFSCFLFFPDSVGNSVSFALNRLAVLRVIRADLLVAGFSDDIDFVSSAFFLGAIGRKEKKGKREENESPDDELGFLLTLRGEPWNGRVSDFLFFYIFIFLAFFRFPALFVNGRSVIGFGGVIGSDEGLKG